MPRGKRKPGPNPFEATAQRIAQIVTEKQSAYGKSFQQAGAVLRLLYPDGVRPEQYGDLLAVTRVIDKLFRVATARDAFGESPWCDITGYALLRATQLEQLMVSSRVAELKARTPRGPRAAAEASSVPATPAPAAPALEVPAVPAAAPPPVADEGAPASPVRRQRRKRGEASPAPAVPASPPSALSPPPPANAPSVQAPASPPPPPPPPPARSAAMLSAFAAHYGSSAVPPAPLPAPPRAPAQPPSPKRIVVMVDGPDGPREVAAADEGGAA